ncbi:MAG: alpha/beta hydrolase [Jatrophihabitans sp.]
MLSGLDLICAQAIITLSVLSGLAWIMVIVLKMHRLRWRWFLPALLLPLVLTTATAADTVNVHFQYLPTAGDVMQAMNGDRQWPTLDRLDRMSAAEALTRYPHGVTTRMPLPADAKDGFRRSAAIAYLPPQYFADAAARFPVVYLFHGSPGKPADWFHGGRAASVGLASANAGKPAIIVAPQMSLAWTDDPECVNGIRERAETHFADVVIPQVDQALRTEANRTGRVFAGMSAGGYCALNLGLRHRNLTGSIIDMSGFTVPTHHGGPSKLFGSDPSVVSQQSLLNSPAAYVPALNPSPSMRIWLDCGRSDPEVLSEMTAIKPALLARGFTVTMTTRPGAHTYQVWRQALAQALPWALGTG